MKGLCLYLTLLVLSLSAHAQQEVNERLAREYSLSGDVEKALSIYQKLYNNGAGPKYYDQYFSSLLQARKFNEARDLVNTMIARDAASPVYKVDLGRVYQESGYREKTDSIYKGLLRNLHKDEFSVRELAAAFYRANAYDYAVTAFTYGRKLLGDERAFAFDLLALYRYKKDKTMLIDEYIRILSSNPEPVILTQAESSFDMLLEAKEDYALLETSLKKALKGKKQAPLLTQLLSWTYSQQERLPEALNLLIGLDRQGAQGEEAIYQTGTMLIDRREFGAALSAFEYLVSKGASDYYFASKARILYCRTELLSSGNPPDDQLNKLAQDYRAFINETDDVTIKAFSLRKLAGFKAYRQKSYADAVKLLQEALSFKGLDSDTKGYIKLDLGDIYALTGDVWEATLLYSQVAKEAHDATLKQEAQFRNARLSYFRGDFVWAQVQLNELKGATNQMLANDALNLSLLISENTHLREDTLSLRAYARADMFFASKHFDKAMGILDSIQATGRQSTLDDDMLMLRARIYLELKKYKEATEALRQVYERYPSDIWADDALFTLGTTYETLHEPEKAKACYEKLISDYPGSLFISEARSRFRNLRGDSLG